MFTSNARQRAARDEAQQAQADAGDEFVALDDTQKTITMVVDAFAGLDAGPAGDRLLGELAPLTRAADTASQGWIDALDQHGRALDDDTSDVRALQNADRAFRSAAQALREAHTQLESFGTRHSDVEARVHTAWSQVAPKIATAQQALTDARRAVAAVESTGLRSADLEAQLERAEQLAKPVADGAHQHGVSATLQHCAEATAAANRTIATAERLTLLAADTGRKLTSTQTRLDGIAGRLEQLDPTLSSLRRRFSVACSADLDQIPAQARGQAEAAHRHLRNAKTHAQTGLWETAAAELDQCRQQLTVAEAGINAVVRRLRDLDAVASDPAQEKASVRFVVRDAQTLVVSAGAAAPANEVRVLDSLVVRLESVDTKLAGNHPDYWGYLVELRSIRELATAVVRRTRVAMAAR